jgi:hypothetical protein
MRQATASVTDTVVVENRLGMMPSEGQLLRGVTRGIRKSGVTELDGREGKDGLLALARHDNGQAVYKCPILGRRN